MRIIEVQRRNIVLQKEPAPALVVQVGSVLRQTVVNGIAPIKQLRQAATGLVYKVGVCLSATAAETDSVWRIREIDMSTGSPVVRTASDGDTFNKAWSLRDTYAYV